MKFQAITIILFGLVLSSFIHAKTLEEACQLRLFPGKPDDTNYIYHTASLNAPFEGWTWNNHAAQTGYTERTLPSIRSVEAHSCIHCALTVFSTDEHSGKSGIYELKEGSVVEFSFDVRSFYLDCEAAEYDLSKDEEAYIEIEQIEFVLVESDLINEEEEVNNDEFVLELYDIAKEAEACIEIEEEEEEEEEEAVFVDFEILSGEEANSEHMLKLYEIGAQKSMDQAKREGLIPAEEYAIFRDVAVEKTVHGGETYRWSIYIVDGKMNSFMIQFAMMDNLSGLSEPELLYYDVSSPN